MEGRVAVLGVVIAGVIASIVEPGIYTLGSTVLGATLVLVLLAYDDHPDERHLQSLAYAGALAFILVPLLGPLLNWLFFVPKRSCIPPSIEQLLLEPSCFDQHPINRRYNSNDAAFFGVWLLATVSAFIYRRKLRWLRWWLVSVPLPILGVLLVAGVAYSLVTA